MNKLYRYVAWRYIKYLFMLHVIEVSLLFLVEFANANNTIVGGSHYQFIKMIKFSLSPIPYYTLQIELFLILLATFFTIYSLKLRNEIDIMQSIKMSPFRILYPVLAISLIWSFFLVSVGSYISSNLLVSYTKTLYKEQNISGNGEGKLLWLLHKNAKTTEYFIFHKSNNSVKLKDIFYIKQTTKNNGIKEFYYSPKGSIYKGSIRINEIYGYNPEGYYPKIQKN